jgi:hypothetical protein
MFGQVVLLNVRIIEKSIDQENIGMEIMNQRMSHKWKLFMSGPMKIIVD